MKWKGFTPEEVLALRSNPYTFTVTEKTISFTREFKERMWEGMQNGRSKRDLIIELGYDPDVLGTTRIEGIAYHIKEEANSPEGFHEGKRISKVAAIMTEAELASSAPCTRDYVLVFDFEQNYQNRRPVFLFFLDLSGFFQFAHLGALS